MTTRRLLSTYAIIAGIISAPVTFIHLTANPDDAPITPLHHVTAAAANYFGPWGVALVRLVDFPNAGLRSFSWAWSIGLTLVGELLVVLAARITNSRGQLALAVVWALFSIAWFGVGLRQIADGLL